ERKELTVKRSQFQSAQIAVNLAVEATGGNFNRGTEPVGIPVVAATGTTAMENRDGEEFGVFAAHADGARHPSPTSLRQGMCCAGALGAGEAELPGDRLPRQPWCAER